MVVLPFKYTTMNDHFIDKGITHKNQLFESTKEYTHSLTYITLVACAKLVESVAFSPKSFSSKLDLTNQL